MSPMAKRQAKMPTWADIKAKLGDFDRAGLLDLVHDLYAAHPENRMFLHTRFGLGANVLDPYKKRIDRWLWPDVLHDQDTSVSQAKRAVTDYKKAVNDPIGLAELMVFYCEQAAGFCNDVGNDDEVFFDALVRMFEQSLQQIQSLPETIRDSFLARLDRVRTVSHNFGYGVGDDMDYLLAQLTKR